jgi:hypothetical protein
MWRDESTVCSITIPVVRPLLTVAAFGGRSDRYHLPVAKFKIARASYSIAFSVPDLQPD